MKPKVGDIYKWINWGPCDIWSITKIEKSNCFLKKIKTQKITPQPYKIEYILNKENWKYIGNNEKIAKILYGD